MSRLVPVILLAVTAVRADGPADNLPDKVRPIPPAGIHIPDADRDELQKSSDELGQQIESLRTVLRKDPARLALLPDVQIFHNAVRYALTHNEFYESREVETARRMLRQGHERLEQLKAGKTPWTTARGLVVRGYVSRIDGSVQPYGLVVPDSYRPDAPYRHRLDVWLHGRGEKLTELNFLAERQASRGQFTPRDAFVLHPYGRYCNAFKFAGEIDVLEALAHVRRHYPIDDDRLVMRGFSMGGAGCWQFAVHYPGLWAAAAPGAGFSETPDFLKVFQKEKLEPTEYERKLWHLYDCTDYALNVYNCPTVAYSGTKDTQKQAADLMERAMGKQGLHLVHILGPDTGHSYHPRAKEEIDRRIDAIAARGRNTLPPRVHFTTWTLRYNRCAWVRLDGLEKHWKRAQIDAQLTDPQGRLRVDVWVDVRNVSAFTLTMPSGACPLDSARTSYVTINDWDSGRSDAGLGAAPVLSDRSWTAHFRKIDGKWKAVTRVDDGTLRKRPGLQGPIDDAFMGSFLMVRPTGQPLNERVGTWVRSEMQHAVDHWRSQFRGEARVKDDADVSDADIAAHNLVLWGDPKSNKVLAKISDKLPLRWSAQEIRAGKETFKADDHVPVLVYPNPLNPKRYVVLNSGFTFREYDYLNNARQVPKLPDYAVIDIKSPRTSRTPGGIATAGFFDERWQLAPELGSRGGEERKVGGVALCWCPPGKFTMGSPADEPERRIDEKQVKVSLTKGFWMGKYEVTQGQWKKVVGKLPGELTAAGGEGDDFPVYNVNYAEAEAFCRKLTERGRQSGDLPKGWEFRLPTEAQWEYACRAGTTTATAFGNKLSSKQANFQGKPYNGAEDGPSLKRATKVGSYPANPWGLHDMHGNVVEWCRDWYHAKLPGGKDPDLSSVKGTMNRDGTFSRVRRGSAWTDDGWASRSAFRQRFEPERRYDHIGFRVVAVRP